MYAACFHLLQLPPQVLVVDDISDFIDSRHAGYLPAPVLLRNIRLARFDNQPQRASLPLRILDRRAREADLVKTLALLHNAVTSVRCALWPSPCATSRPCLLDGDLPTQLALVFSGHTGACSNLISTELRLCLSWMYMLVTGQLCPRYALRGACKEAFHCWP